MAFASMTDQMSSSAAVSARVTALALRVLEAMFQDYGPYDFAVRLWDGTVWPAPQSRQHPPRLTLVFHSPAVLRWIVHPWEAALRLCEAYLFGEMSLEGDLAGLAAIQMYYCIRRRFSLRQFVTLGLLRWSLPGGPMVPQLQRTRRPRARLTGAVHSLARDRAAIAYHYDVSNDFYALWLDPRMVYTCAYFPTGTEDLETAQVLKLERICRKLQLRPGERLLDVGCGWGGLLIYAAQHYGVSCVGITLSAQQHAFAQARIREAGVQDRCRVELTDYRTFRSSEPFDKITSIEMYEAIGTAQLPTYLTQLLDALKPGGLFLQQGISTDAQQRGRSSSERIPFVGRYVFPDGELCDIGYLIEAAERAGWETIDVESIRRHYVLTLQHWARRLDERHAEALQFVDEPTFRVWQLYLNGSSYFFDTGFFTNFQLLLAKPTATGQRAHLRIDCVLSAALSDFTRARRVSLVASFSEREGANQCEAIHEAFRSVTLG